MSTDNDVFDAFSYLVWRLDERTPKHQSSKRPEVLYTLLKRPEVLYTLLKCPEVLYTLLKRPEVLYTSKTS